MSLRDDVIIPRVIESNDGAVLDAVERATLTHETDFNVD